MKTEARVVCGFCGKEFWICETTPQDRYPIPEHLAGGERCRDGSVEVPVTGRRYVRA